MLRLRPRVPAERPVGRRLLDILLSGRGSKIQHERVIHFLGELAGRLHQRFRRNIGSLCYGIRFADLGNRWQTSAFCCLEWAASSGMSTDKIPSSRLLVVTRSRRQDRQELPLLLVLLSMWGFPWRPVCQNTTAGRLLRLSALRTWTGLCESAFAPSNDLSLITHYPFTPLRETLWSVPYSQSLAQNDKEPSNKNGSPPARKDTIHPMLLRETKGSFHSSTGRSSASSAIVTPCDSMWNKINGQ